MLRCVRMHTATKGCRHTRPQFRLQGQQGCTRGLSTSQRHEGDEGGAHPHSCHTANSADEAGVGEDVRVAHGINSMARVLAFTEAQRVLLKARLQQNGEASGKGQQQYSRGSEQYNDELRGTESDNMPPSYDEMYG